MSDLFSGTSRYSTDFQAVIDRSIAIASLPLSQMQSIAGAAKADQAALSSIDSKFAALQSAIEGLEAAAGAKSYTGSVSESSILSVSLGDGVTEGTYKLTVKDFGSYATSLSKKQSDGTLRVIKPALENITAATKFRLKLDGDATGILLEADSLEELVTAINEAAGEHVAATLVNVGDPDGGVNYRLNVQSRYLRAYPITLETVPESGAGVQLLDQIDAGAPVKYLVKGADADAVSSSRSVELASGVSVSFRKADTATEVTVDVKRGTSSVQSALKSFATAYNAVIDELDKHRGENTGSLSGEGIVSTLTGALTTMSVWDSGTGAQIASLSELGFLVSREGKLELDDADFTLATKDDLAGLMQFLGAAETGGFLKMASDQLEMIRKEDTGLLSAARDVNDAAVKSQDDRVAAEQERIDNLRVSLQEQFSRADALIASLEQQASYINNLFESMRIASETMN